MVYVLKFGFQLETTANIRQYDCVRLVCVCDRKREWDSVFWPDIPTTANLNFQNYLCILCVLTLGICYVANHIVCKCEQLYFFTLTHMSLLSFSCLKSSSTKLNWFCWEQTSLPYSPKQTFIIFSMTFAIYFYKCPLSEWDILYS